MSYSNRHNLSFPALCWLLRNEYTGNSGEKCISATSLTKPLRELLLSRQTKVTLDSTTIDASDLFSSRLGTALHSAIYDSVVKATPEVLQAAGIPKNKIKDVVINPTQLTGKEIPIYLEQRKYREVNGWTVNGQFDCVVNGEVNDYKLTKVNQYTGVVPPDYVLQMSIYRWIDPSIITSDVGVLNYFLKDWQKSKSLKDRDYPIAATLTLPCKLLSIEETDRYIKNKLRKLDAGILPECTPEERWQSKPTYKYYSSSEATRASRVFTSKLEAERYALGRSGFIKTIPAENKRCKYCTVGSICKTYKE